MRSSSSAMSSSRFGAGDLEHLVRDRLDDGRPRVEVLVHPVAEPHQPYLAPLHPVDIRGDVVNRADVVEHPQHLLVRAAVQRPVERGGGRCRRRVRVGPGTADHPHRAGGAVLLVVGVQGEQHVERVGEDRIRVVPGLGHPPHHAQEVSGVGQFVVGVGIRQSHRVPVGERRQRRHLRDQPDDLLVPPFGVGDLLRPRVERGQRRDRAHQDAHRVGVVVEPVDELLHVLVHERVLGDLVRPGGGFLLPRQLTVDQQGGHVEERHPPGELLDRVAPVPQDALLPVDEGDGAAAVRRVHEGWIIGEQPEVVVGSLDLAQVSGPDRTIGDRQFVGAARAAVGYVQHALRLGGVRCHAPSSSPPAGGA